MSSRSRLLRLDRYRFLAWAWTMLLVILISAAPDGGAPGSRSIGSAFDPATSAVATARQHSRIAVGGVQQAAKPALPLAGTGGLAVAAALAEVPLFFLSSPALRVAHSQAPGDPRSRSRAHGPRAPPFA